MISDAIQLLYDEHETIVLAIDKLESLLADGSDDHVTELKNLIEFFRTYADGYHHAKEEQILFPRLIRANPALQAIADSLEDHHQQFRESLTSAAAALEAGDTDKAANELARYCNDLRDHISAEDDELFVVAEEVLNEKEKEEIGFLFIDTDRSAGIEAKQRLERDAVGA